MTGESSDSLSSGEQSELAALRTRVAALETGAGRPARHRVRSLLSALLIVLAAVLAPLSVVAVWTSDLVGNTDRYVATMTPLATNADIQAAVSNRATTAVMSHLDISQLLDDAAPADRPALDALLPKLQAPITGALTSFVHSAAQRVVTSAAFATLWTELNRRAHAAINKALTGDTTSAVQLTDNAVIIDLAPVIDQVKQQLVDGGLTIAGKIPEVHTDFTVVQSQDIGKVKTGFRLLQLAGAWLPIITVAIAAGGVLLAARRRRALVTAALSVAVGAAVLGLGLELFRTVYLDNLPADASLPAAGAVYDILTRFLRTTIRTVITLGIIVGFGAWLSGKGRYAARSRSVWESGIGAARAATGVRTGPVGPWVHRHKRWLVWAAPVLAGLVLAVWSYPTGMVILWLALAVLLVLAVVEFLDDPGQGPAASPRDPAARAEA